MVVCWVSKKKLTLQILKYWILYPKIISQFFLVSSTILKVQILYKQTIQLILGKKIILYLELDTVCLMILHSFQVSFPLQISKILWPNQLHTLVERGWLPFSFRNYFGILLIVLSYKKQKIGFYYHNSNEPYSLKS